MEKLYLTMKYNLPEVTLSNEVIKKGLPSITKMLEISKAAGLQCQNGDLKMCEKFSSVAKQLVFLPVTEVDSDIIALLSNKTIKPSVILNLFDVAVNYST